MQLKEQSIVNAQFVARAARAQLDKAVHSAQLKCKHPSLAEAAGSPPTRICLCCGMTEDGWGPGYVVLKQDGELTPPGISRDRLYELRVGLMIVDSMKGPLLRKETSVAQLVDEQFPALAPERRRSSPRVR